MATSEGIPSSIDIEFLELNDNPYHSCVYNRTTDILLREECTAHERLQKNLCGRKFLGYRS